MLNAIIVFLNTTQWGRCLLCYMLCDVYIFYLKYSFLFLYECACLYTLLISITLGFPIHKGSIRHWSCICDIQYGVLFRFFLCSSYVFDVHSKASSRLNTVKLFITNTTHFFFSTHWKSVFILVINLSEYFWFNQCRVNCLTLSHLCCSF